MKRESYPFVDVFNPPMMIGVYDDAGEMVGTVKYLGFVEVEIGDYVYDATVVYRNNALEIGGISAGTFKEQPQGSEDFPAARKEMWLALKPFKAQLAASAGTR